MYAYHRDEKRRQKQYMLGASNGERPIPIEATLRENKNNTGYKSYSARLEGPLQLAHERIVVDASTQEASK